jgi:glutathione S-transferase
MSNAILYGPAYSTYARSVRLALEEKGAPYSLEEVDIFSGANLQDSHLARQPFGKVPSLEMDGFMIYETSAINRFIDEMLSGPSLQPSDPKARARMNQIISVIDNYAYAALVTALVIQRLVVPLQGGEPDEGVIEDAMPRAEVAVKALDGLLSAKASESLDLGDIHLIPIWDYVSNTPEAEALGAMAPNLLAWWASVKDRPSVEHTRPSLG